MPIRKIEGLRKITINLTAETIDRLSDIYAGIGYQRAIREILDAHVARLNASRARIVETLVDEVDLEEI